MIARQCSSCGGMCGGGYTVNGKYKFCKALNPKQKQFDNEESKLQHEDRKQDRYNFKRGQ